MENGHVLVTLTQWWNICLKYLCLEGYNGERAPGDLYNYDAKHACGSLKRQRVEVHMLDSPPQCLSTRNFLESSLVALMDTISKS